jgi:hypothetical protein
VPSTSSWPRATTALRPSVTTSEPVRAGPGGVPGHRPGWGYPTGQPRAASLLGVAQHFLIGRPLAVYVATEDRWRLRDRLGRLDAGSWELLVQPRQREAVQVTMSTSVVRDEAGELIGLRWVLIELPSASVSPTEEPPTSTAAAPSLLAELVTSRSAASPSLTVVPSLASDWDLLGEGLAQVVETAVPLLGADGAGLMLADADGGLHWVTGTSEAERAFERAERDLGEGPCVDAFASGSWCGPATCGPTHAGHGWARRPGPTWSVGSWPPRCSRRVGRWGPAMPSP